jgi:hypothetical protein
MLTRERRADGVLFPIVAMIFIFSLGLISVAASAVRLSEVVADSAKKGVKWKVADVTWFVPYPLQIIPSMLLIFCQNYPLT